MRKRERRRSGMVPIFPDLGSLFDIACKGGAGIRPALVGVLTELYVQKQRHSEEEERHYCELALRLLEAVDLPTRAAVAAKLAAYPAAPAAVLDRLARDSIEVAGPILGRSADLYPTELGAAARHPDATDAALIAHRLHESPTHRSSEPERNSAAPKPPSGITDRNRAAAIELSELFASANSNGRRLVLAKLQSMATARAIRPAAQVRAIVERLFVRELAQSLSISVPHARWIVADEDGEPIVVATKAIGMASPALQRILLFLNPVIGHSVRRVFDLAELYEKIKPEAAGCLVWIWQHAHPQPEHPPAHPGNPSAARARPTATNAVRFSSRPTIATAAETTAPVGLRSGSPIQK
jgi:hypothetical protein